MVEGKMYRVVATIERVEQGVVYVTLPGWRTNVEVPVPVGDVPEVVLHRSENTEFAVYMNLGAQSVEDVVIDWSSLESPLSSLDR